MTDLQQVSNGQPYRDAVNAQASASNPSTSAWVSANAGSGKTKVLIDRVARLLLAKATPESILCLTYTKAAANEMLSRFFETLGEWSILPEDELSNKLARLEGKESGQYSSEDLRYARALFARALETPGGLRIETIHSFCGRVLQRFPVEAKISPKFDTIDEQEAEKLWRESCDKSITSAPTDALDQLVEACGGRGALAGLNMLRGYATEVIRYATFRSKEIALGEDFDEANVVERHYDRSGVNTKTKVVDYATIDADLRETMQAPKLSMDDYLAKAMKDDFPLQALQRVAEQLASGKATDIKTSEKIRDAIREESLSDRWELYRGIFATSTGAWRANNPYTAAYADTEVSDNLQVKGEKQGREYERVVEIDRVIRALGIVQNTLALLRVGLPALIRYGREKKRTAKLDFEDLIQSTRQLLEVRHTREWVRYKIDGAIQHVLVDEAQDNSPDQWKLVKSLTEEFFTGTDKERNIKQRTLFAVGDEKQSIYAFQGADPEQFKTNKGQYQAKAEKFVSPKMEMSFRSSPEILKFVDEVFGKNLFPDSSPFSTLPDEGVLKHDAFRGKQPGCVEFWDIVAPDTEDDDSVPWDAPINFESAKSPKTMLVQDIAEAIKKMIDGGEQIRERQPNGDWILRPIQYQDILILVRNRVGGLFDSIIRALKERNIPVAGADRLTLTDHIGVQDCLNLMRFVLLPEDDLTLAEILRGPFCDLVDDDNHLFPLAFDRGHRSLWSRLKENRDSPTFLRAFEFCSWLIEMRDEPPFEFLSKVLERPFYGEDGWSNLSRRLGTPAREPIEELLNKAEKHDEEQASSLQSFVAEMDKDTSQVKRELSSPDKEIRVMTCHGAKGLQSPIVILPDTTSAVSSIGSNLFLYESEHDEDHKIPLWSANKRSDVGITETIRSEREEKGLREHRRLLYVALTRAQDRLIVCGAWYGSKNAKNGFAKNSWYEHCRNAIEEMNVAPSSRQLIYTCQAKMIGIPSPPENKRTEEKRETDEVAPPDWLNKNVPYDLSEGEVRTQGASTMRDAPVIVPFRDMARTLRMKRGDIIHSLLEILPNIPESKWQETASDRVSKISGFSIEEKNRIVDSTMKVLKLSEVFAQDSRAEVPIIGSLEGYHGRIINGRVDRLVVREDKVIIIDFKTNRRPPKDESKVPMSYLVQMATYQAVLRQIYPSKDIECALLWTEGPTLMQLKNDTLYKTLEDTVKSAQTTV